MIISIGVRAWKDRYQYVCLQREGEEWSLVERDVSMCPKGDRSSQLHWIRNDIIELLQKHSPCYVGIKTTETGQRVKPDAERCEIEGVILEACCAEGIQSLKLRKQKIKSLTGFESMARYLDELIDNAEYLKDLPKTYYDAALAAIAALESC